MGGLTLYGSLVIGIVLVVGHRLFPDNIVMWFASPENTMVAWREVIVFLLVGLAVIRQYYHNLYSQVIWGLVAAALLRSGYMYFLDNPAYMFDAMLMLGAGAAFAVTALMPGGDPVDIATVFRWILPVRFMTQFNAFRLVVPVANDDMFASWRYISDSCAFDHRLTIQPEIMTTTGHILKNVFNSDLCKNTVN